MNRKVLALTMATIAALTLATVGVAQDTKNPAFAACLKKNGVDISKKGFSKDPDMPKALAACTNVGSKNATGKRDFGFAACLKKNGVDPKSKNWVKDKDLPKAAARCGQLLTKKRKTVACLKKNGVDLKKRDWVKDEDLWKALAACDQQKKGGKQAGAKKAQSVDELIAEIDKLVAAGKLDPETAAAKKKALKTGK